MLFAGLNRFSEDDWEVDATFFKALGVKPKQIKSAAEGGLDEEIDRKADDNTALYRSHLKPLKFLVLTQFL